MIKVDDDIHSLWRGMPWWLKAYFLIMGVFFIFIVCQGR